MSANLGICFNKNMEFSGFEFSIAPIMSDDRGSLAVLILLLLLNYFTNPVKTRHSETN